MATQHNARAAPQCHATACAPDGVVFLFVFVGILATLSPVLSSCASNVVVVVVDGFALFVCVFVLRGVV